MVEISNLDTQYTENLGLLEDKVISRKSLLLELESLLRNEELFWKQKAKYKWLNEENGNTKFFHRIANGRKRKNLITK